MGHKERPGIYDFEDEASDIAKIYEFSTEFPASLESEHYQSFLNDRVGSERIEDLAELWLDAQEKTEFRLNMLGPSNSVEQSPLFVQSSLNILQTFYTTANRFIDAEEEFLDHSDDLDNYQTLSDVMHSKDIDYPRSTKETLKEIEEFRDSYLESEEYDFLRGY